MSVSFLDWSVADFAADMASRFSVGEGVSHREDLKSYVRPQFSVDGPYVVEGSTEHVEPFYGIDHDYGPATIMVDYFESFVNGDMDPMPFIPPFASAPEKMFNHYQAVSEFEEELVHTLKLSVSDEILSKMPRSCVPSEDGLPYLRWGELSEEVVNTNDKRSVSASIVDYFRPVDKDAAFLKLTASQQALRLREASHGLMMIFNPFCLQGARMVQTMRLKKNRYVGTYILNRRTYRFVWFYDTRAYIVNSDLWSKKIKPRFQSMMAFSLACPVDFWTFGMYDVKQSTPFVCNFRVKEDIKLPYDISNSLGRRDSKGKFVMTYGNSVARSVQSTRRVVSIKELEPCNIVSSRTGDWILEKKKNDSHYVRRRASGFDVRFMMTEGDKFRRFIFRGSEIAVAPDVIHSFGIIDTVSCVLMSVRQDDPGDDVFDYHNNPLTFFSWHNQHTYQRKKGNKNDVSSSCVQSDFGLIDYVHSISDMSVAVYLKTWLSILEPFNKPGHVLDESVVTGDPDDIEEYEC